MDRQEFLAENTQAAALAALLDTVTPRKRPVAGHVLSLVMNRLAGSGADGVARNSDTKEHLTLLKVLFESLAYELAEAIETAPDGVDTLTQDPAVLCTALTARVEAALAAEIPVSEIRVRRTDLGGNPQTDLGVKRAFLSAATGLPNEVISLNQPIKQ